ncbi:RES domain-containing protein [Paenibacillus alvei]|uniref:RES domain-containing protein n=1 Tax=Paenibacillus alvei TaxID=44250 RepID=UPI002282984D|nr:RES domain-containing protein [Paenibacillus alvei]MCY9737470.1 RES domain-containing protein [Paenibacillus alvei]
MNNLNNSDLSNLTMCSGCASEIEDRIRKMKTYNDFEFESEEKEDDDELICSVCNSKIEIEDNYTTDNVEYIFGELAKDISKHIGGCEHCHGNELRYREYQINQGEDTNFEFSHGDDADSFLQDEGIPCDFVKIFVELIECPACGYGKSYDPSDYPISGVFDVYSEIYSKKEVDDFYGFDYIEFSLFAQEYGITITREDLASFKNHLTQYPMLATEHETGSAILETIRNYYNSGDYDRDREVPLETVYRGRARKKDSKKLEKNEMWSPPYGASSHGRFNSIGLSVLYLCSDIKAIPYEIHPTHEDVIDIATFKIEKDLKLFDISKFVSDFEGFFDEINEETKILKHAYLLPNFIGMCCNLVGFDGIMYEGVHDRLKYINYALFNTSQDDKALIVEDVVTYNLEITIDININDASTVHTYNEF